MISDERHNALVGIGTGVGVTLLIGFLTAIINAKTGEVAGALGSVLGGVIGASGAAFAVHLTLTTQRKEDRARINGALAREITEFARMILRRLDICENIRVGEMHLQKSRLAEVMEMPKPIIYPAVADKIDILLHPQLIVTFYALIVEIDRLARFISLAPLPNPVKERDIKHVVATLVDVAHIAQLIITDSEPEADFDRAVKDRIVRQLRHQLALVRDSFQIEDEQLAKSRSEGAPV